jgi:hypothetical protein
MLIQNAYVKIFKVKDKSFQALVGFAEDEKGNLPLLMLTASRKVMKDVKKNEEYVCDIMLKKDDSYNTWLVIKKVHEQINKG